MENSSNILKTVCLVVLAFGSCAFAYSLGWQHGEASGNQNTLMRMESIASSVRTSQLEWGSDEVDDAPAATPTKATAAAGPKADAVRTAVAPAAQSGQNLPAKRGPAGPQAALDCGAN